MSFWRLVSCSAALLGLPGMFWAGGKKDQCRCLGEVFDHLVPRKRLDAGGEWANRVDERGRSLKE